VLPIGWGEGPDDRPRTVVACEPLLRQMCRAGVSRALVVLGTGKWDVPAFLGDGARVGLDLAYLVIDDSPSTAHTVARASGHLGDATIVFGFPDLVLQPADALELLVARHRAGDADVVLGLFPTNDPSQFDMVETGSEGVVRQIVVKPAATNLRSTWLAAVWGAAFTAFVQEWVTVGRAAEAAPAREAYIGDVVQAAVVTGMRVVGVEVPGGAYDDVGAPGSLAGRFFTF
jgi:glucose-1-phosphate thymidylyltransferase